MSETIDGLVSWDAPEDLGKIPGSDWICPQNDAGLDELFRITEENGRSLTSVERRHYL